MSEICKVRCILDDCYLNDIDLVEVFVDTVTDPKNISKVVLELNRLFPVPELAHLKRVKAREVLLFLSGNIREDKVHEILGLNGFREDLLKNEIRKVEVAAIPPLVRHQYVKCHSRWPCNFHSDKYLEKLWTNTLFCDQDLKKISTFMRMANKLGNLSKISGKGSGVLVVDPVINSVVAVGYDRSFEGPCRHAVMVAIDNVAKSQNGGAWKNSEENCIRLRDNLNLNGIPEHLLGLLKQDFSAITFGASVFTPKSGNPDGPYLCTGYHVYTTREPCIMCAMALTHSRCKRVFYGTTSENGALGTLCKIHTVKDLNHHYEVFIVDDEPES